MSRPINHILQIREHGVWYRTQQKSHHHHFHNFFSENEIPTKILTHRNICQNNRKLIFFLRIIQP